MLAKKYSKIIKKSCIFIIAFLFFAFLMNETLAMRMKGNSGVGAIRIRAPNASDINFTTSVNTIQTVIEEGSIEYAITQDLNTSVRIAPTILNEGQISVSIDISPYDIEFSSLDSGIATVDSDGYVTRVSNGTARISVGNHFLRKVVNVAVSLSADTPVTTYESYVSGSLGKNVSDTIDNRITDVTEANAATYKPIYSTQNHTDSIYVRNTSSWVYGLDLTPISPWNSSGGAYRAGTLISPRHIVFANHYPISNGSKIRFVTQDNVVVERTMTSSARVGPTDIKIGVLDSDVPEIITFARLLPDDWADYIPGLTTLSIPCFYTDQQEKALVNMLSSYGILGNFYFNTPIDSYPSRKVLFETLISGDSGNPGFLIVNNQLVILTTWTGGGAGAGPNLTTNKTTINSVMTSLGGGYQTTDADLSGFTKY